ATAEVPVYHVFQPVAKPSVSGRFGFPVDGIVQFHHPFFQCCGTNEPCIEGIIKNGLIGSPAMRIIVLVFFYTEGLVAFLQINCYVYVYIHIIFLVFIILYISVTEFSQTVYKLSFTVYQVQQADSVFFTYFIVICTVGRSSMYNTGTVFCGNKISYEYPEWITTGIFRSISLERQQLLITNFFQFSAGKCFQDFPGDNFILLIILIKISVFAFG